jgi:TRAP transporter TAXI family solute receptor
MRNKARFSGLLSLLLVIVMMMTACGSTASTASESTTSSSSAAETTASGTETTGTETVPTVKEDVILGTGGTAGTYYVVGAAMGKVISERSDKINVIVQATKGSMENINLTNVGDIQLGMSNADGVYFGYYGTGSYENIGTQDIVGLMSLYMSAGHMVVKSNSGIASYADLKGKKVCLGPPSTTIVEMSKAILRAYGVDPENDIKPYYLSFDEGVSKLVDGDLDATFFVAGIPTAALMNASATADVDLVTVDDEMLDQIVTDSPYYEKYVIPAGTYKGIDHDTATLKIMTNIFAKSTLSDEAAYDFVKNALEGVEDYATAHNVVKEITPETAWQVPVPLHPGAEKYYREIGVIQ